MINTGFADIYFMYGKLEHEDGKYRRIGNAKEMKMMVKFNSLKDRDRFQKEMDAFVVSQISKYDAEVLVKK